MNKNIKIAKELVKLAKYLISTDKNSGMYGQCPECTYADSLIFMPGKEKGYCYVCGREFYRYKDGIYNEDQQKVCDDDEFNKGCVGIKIECPVCGMRVDIGKNDWQKNNECKACGCYITLTEDGKIWYDDDCKGWKEYKNVMELKPKFK